MNNIVIVGFGEVGSALNEIYKESNKYSVYVYDKKIKKDITIDNCSILNICIPYSGDFVEEVKKYINKFNPEITVIHSTVAPGTTSKIGGSVCHSPVRGLHPDLKDGIKTFLKYIGSDSQDVSLRYSDHLKELGIQSYICKDSITSEYAKLLDTTYYGVCIAWHSDVMNMCGKLGLDFDEVMTFYNKSYNEGYASLGVNNVIRPVLYPTNKIGGHCIVPNAKILDEYFDSPFISGILNYE